jgi:hypothetical protein
VRPWGPGARDDVISFPPLTRGPLSKYLGPYRSFLHPRARPTAIPLAKLAHGVAVAVGDPRHVLVFRPDIPRPLFDTSVRSCSASLPAYVNAGLHYQVFTSIRGGVLKVVGRPR